MRAIGSWSTGAGSAASVLTKVDHGVNIGAEVTLIVVISLRGRWRRLASARRSRCRHAPA